MIDFALHHKFKLGLVIFAYVFVISTLILIPESRKISLLGITGLVLLTIGLWLDYIESI